MQTKAIAICICLIAAILVAGCTNYASSCCGTCGTQTKTAVITKVSGGDVSRYTYYIQDSDGIKYGFDGSKDRFDQSLCHNVTFQYKCDDGHYLITDVISQCQRPLCMCTPEPCGCGC